MSCPTKSRFGSGKTLEAAEEHIESGNAYVNVHTLENPGGEVRGQIVAH